MLKILLAVDGSPNALRATQYVITLSSHLKAMDLHLLNVQVPVSGDVKRFIDAADISRYHHDEGIKALASARQALDSASVSYNFHIGVGAIAQTLGQYAKQEHIGQIVMGTHGQSALSNLILGSVTQSLIKLLDIPITLIK